MTEQEKLEMYAQVIQGLISYHERMLVCSTGVCHPMLDICPMKVFQKDVYLETLKNALELIEAKINEREVYFKHKEELDSNEHILRCLICYHKKALLPIKRNNPEKTQQDDVYLRAMEKALELIEEKQRSENNA